MSTEVKPLSKNSEDWLNRKWRPAMAWTYMSICIFDFIVAPILNYIFFGRYHGEFISWKPLTMSDGGLFHMAMGVVLGITAWTRGQEKLRTPYRSYNYNDDNDYDTADYRDRRIRHASREDGQ